MNQKKTISKVYNSKVFWIIISLLCSFVMWAYITSPNSSDFQKTFRGVQVEFAGQEKLLSDRDLSISSVDTQSVTVTLRGSRNSVGKLKASDIKARFENGILVITLPSEKQKQIESKEMISID